LVRQTLSPTSLPPPSMASRPSVFDALRSGDPDVMFDLARSLRQEQPDNQAAVRLEAMALLAQGKADEGLEQLEQSARAVTDAPAIVRAQATLALAVGYARVGEGRQAALTALHALIDARQSGNSRAEQACAQLLAQLAANDGAHEAA